MLKSGLVSGPYIVECRNRPTVVSSLNGDSIPLPYCATMKPVAMMESSAAWNLYEVVLTAAVGNNGLVKSMTDVPVADVPCPYSPYPPLAVVELKIVNGLASVVCPWLGHVVDFGRQPHRQR